MVPKHKALAAPELLDPEVMSALRHAGSTDAEMKTGP